MDLFIGFGLGLLLLAASALFWWACRYKVPARYLYPLWLSVPLHQLLSLALVLTVGITPEHGWFTFGLLLALTVLLTALLLLPLLVFVRYTALCRPLQDKI